MCYYRKWISGGTEKSRTRWGVLFLFNHNCVTLAFFTLLKNEALCFLNPFRIAINANVHKTSSIIIAAMNIIRAAPCLVTKKLQKAFQHEDFFVWQNVKLQICLRPVKCSNADICYINAALTSHLRKLYT